MSAQSIRVLIIDDSAFARKVIREVLERDPAIQVVGIARDGLEGLEKIAELKPDVITLDLVMPDLDGLGVLRALPKISPPKVIVVSVSGAESELGIEALHLGAIDLITKPTALPTDRLYELSNQLAAKVKAAVSAKSRVNDEEIIRASASPMKVNFSGEVQMVVLGTSTGGPQAISEIFNFFPADFPVPLLIALHIPSGYTASLAARVSKTSQLKLVEAHDGMELVKGQAVIAPGGMHLQVRKKGGRLIASVSAEPIDTLYHPSVDLLFSSAAEVMGSSVLGVVLTGMGSDGTLGAKSIRDAGGKVIVESESSCVVFGMPRSVMESGLSNDEAVLEKIPALIGKYLSEGSKS